MNAQRPLYYAVSISIVAIGTAVAYRIIRSNDVLIEVANCSFHAVGIQGSCILVLHVSDVSFSSEELILGVRTAVKKIVESAVQSGEEPELEVLQGKEVEVSVTPCNELLKTLAWIDRNNIAKEHRAYKAVDWLSKQALLSFPIRTPRNDKSIVDNELLRGFGSWSEWTPIFLQRPFGVHAVTALTYQDGAWIPSTTPDVWQWESAQGPPRAGVYEFRIVSISFEKQGTSIVDPNPTGDAEVVYVGKAKHLRNNFSTYRSGRPAFWERVLTCFESAPPRRDGKMHICAQIETRWIETDQLRRGFVENLLLAAFDYPWNKDNNDKDY